MLDFISNIGAVVPDWLAAITALIAAASAIAALTPTPKDDAIFAKVYGVLDWLALNVFKAKDKAE